MVALVDLLYLRMENGVKFCDACEEDNSSVLSTWSPPLNKELLNKFRIDAFCTLVNCSKMRLQIAADTLATNRSKPSVEFVSMLCFCLCLCLAFSFSFLEHNEVKRPQELDKSCEMSSSLVIQPRNKTTLKLTSKLGITSWLAMFNHSSLLLVDVSERVLLNRRLHFCKIVLTYHRNKDKAGLLLAVSLPNTLAIKCV